MNDEKLKEFLDDLQALIACLCGLYHEFDCLVKNFIEDE